MASARLVKETTFHQVGFGTDGKVPMFDCDGCHGTFEFADVSKEGQPVKFETERQPMFCPLCGKANSER